MSPLPNSPRLLKGRIGLLAPDMAALQWFWPALAPLPRCSGRTSANRFKGS